MPAYDRRYADKPHQRPYVPPLDLDLSYRARDRDVRPRRARWDKDRVPWPDRDFLRNQYVVSRASSYGYDNDYVKQYVSGRGHTARVSLYTHDSLDPFSCTCFPRASSKGIPSMMYDQVKCPHPDHYYQQDGVSAHWRSIHATPYQSGPSQQGDPRSMPQSPRMIPMHRRGPEGEQDYFAYPWTVQGHRPTVPVQHGYRQGQVKPPSAVTAPPFTLYNRKEDNPSKGGKHPPYSAPVKPVLAPLLSGKPTDRRLRRADRKRLAAIPEFTSTQDELSPFDSVSQIGAQRSFRPESLRLRTVDTRVLGRVESELRMYPQNRALSTPPARPVLDADGFPQTPTRIFKGEYVDPRDGQKYQYDIKYGKLILDGKRTLKSV